MTTNTNPLPLFWRLYSVWFRHYTVYTNHLFSNGFPPFVEPLIFLSGIGIGIGSYIIEMDGIPYIQFLASGLIVSSAMYTAAFECTYGTFIRMDFDSNYDAMLSSPISPADIIIGEIIWAGSKGMFFSSAVTLVLTIFQIIYSPYLLCIPFIGLITGMMIAGMSLIVTSFIRTISHFGFYFTGCITPMFFFSGIIFPTSRLPTFLQPIVEILPLSHIVTIARASATGTGSWSLLYDIAYCIACIALTMAIAVRRLRKRLIK